MSGQGSTTRRRNSRRVRAFICGFRCSGEIVANCGFNATRVGQTEEALSRRNTLPKRWHASKRRILTEIKGKRQIDKLETVLFNAIFWQDG